MQNLVWLPEANELPIVNALSTGTLRLTLAEQGSRFRLHKLIRQREYKRQNVHMLRSQLLLSEQSCQSCFSEIKQVNPAEHLWSINGANGNKGLTDIFKRHCYHPSMWSISGCYIRNNFIIYEAPNIICKIHSSIQSSYYPESKKFKRALITLRVIL